MLPDKLKMRSDAQLVADMHRYLFAKIDRTGKLPSFCLHHLSGSSLASVSGILWYISNSLLSFCCECKYINI